MVEKGGLGRCCSSDSLNGVGIDVIPFVRSIDLDSEREQSRRAQMALMWDHEDQQAKE